MRSLEQIKERKFHQNSGDAATTLSTLGGVSYEESMPSMTFQKVAAVGPMD